MKVNVPIIGKIVGEAVVTTMTITKKNEFGAFIKGNDLGIFVGIV